MYIYVYMHIYLQMELVHNIKNELNTNASIIIYFLNVLKYETFCIPFLLFIIKY